MKTSLENLYVDIGTSRVNRVVLTFCKLRVVSMTLTSKAYSILFCLSLFGHKTCF